MKNDITIGFAGNPNCGKTTLFNAYTGSNLKVANWPGVTVERMEGAIKEHDLNIRLVDLPGTYGLTSHTMEEQVSRQFILSDEVDVIINVVDASALERSLYLTLQLIELGKPVVMALNMMDIIEKRGIEIDLHRFPEILGIPIVPVSARKRKGIQSLMHAAAHEKDCKKPNCQVHNHKPCDIHEEIHKPFTMVYSDKIENKIEAISKKLLENDPKLENARWYAIKLLEKDDEITKKYKLPLSDIIDRSYETDMTNEKYDFIEEVLKEVMVGQENKAKSTDRIDRFLTNKYLGIPFFLIVMGFVFFLTFTVGDFLKTYMEQLIGWISSGATFLLTAAHASDWIRSLVVDGIIAGVGGIVTFLPNIVILFLALAFLEDSGYMARVAYIMDGIMGHLGLSGRAFLPMILGFGCTVPAIMASRALESKRDRYKVMLITPFMSCNARLPIYILFSGIFFKKYAMLVAYSMYLLGLLVALLVAFVTHKLDKSAPSNALLIELPDYKAPSIQTILIYVWENVKGFLTKAGTIIFVASVIMWFLLNFNFTGYTADITNSIASSLGKLIVPILKPVGLGFWQIAVALIAGVSAKEVVVSSTGILFGITNMNSFEGISGLSSSLASIGFGPLNALCMMVFCLLYTPCVATLTTIRKESGSTLFMVASGLFQLLVAWVISFLVFQIGSLII